MWSNYECLSLRHLKIRNLLPKIDEIRNLIAINNFEILLSVKPSLIMKYWTQRLILIENRFIVKTDPTRSVVESVYIWTINILSLFVMIYFHCSSWSVVQCCWSFVGRTECWHENVSNISDLPTSVQGGGGSSYFNDILGVIENASKRIGYDTVGWSQIWLRGQWILT